MDNIIHNIKTELLEQNTRTKYLLKEITRLEKQITKTTTIKNKTKSTTPNGFARPTQISETLTNFMLIEPTTKVSRTEATKYIIKYIKNNNLQNPEHKNQIVPDNALQILLGENIPDPLTYFNFQKCMNPHFIHETK